MQFFRNLLEWFRQRHTPSISPEELQELTDKVRAQAEADLNRAINRAIDELKRKH